MTIIQKIKGLKSLRSRLFLSLFSFFAMILVATGVQGAFYVYLVIIGMILACYGSRGTSAFTLPVVLFTSIFWSTGLIIGICGLSALLSIPIGSWILWIPFGIILLLLICVPLTFQKSFFKVEIFEWILLLFSFVSIFAYIYSVRGFVAPILHDPMSHATWAKLIFNSGYVSHYYSPGLHFMAALGMGVDGVAVATYIMILTNLFNALIFLPVFYFIKFYFKKTWFAFLSSSLFLIGSFPSKFFWEAGKNALIIAMGFSFFLFFVASLKISRNKKLLIINFLTFILILIHYPMAIIGVIGVAFILIYKDGLKGLMHICGGIFAGLVWILVFVGDELTNRVGSAPGISSFFEINLSFSGLVGFIKNTYNATKFPFQSEPGSLILLLGVTGLFVMMVISINRKRFLFFILYLITNIFLMFILTSVPILDKLWIVYSTQLLTFFVFYYIGTAFLLSEVIFPYLFKTNKYISFFFVVIVIALVGFRSFQNYSDFRYHQDRKNLVQEADLILFDWISSNLSENSVILNNAIIGGTNNGSVFPSDAGGWLPAFSDRKIAMPFTTFNSESNREIYQIYENVLEGEYSCDDIRFLLNNGFTYYYKGSRQIYGPQLLPEENHPEFSLIFAVDNAKLYEIMPCK